MDDLIRMRFRDVVRARARRGGDAVAATEMWGALLRGCWVLVDRFDGDGTCFLVAVRDPGHDEAPVLNERERQVCDAAADGLPNKLIACELGLAVSTVAVHLRNALRKLGLASRSDLITVLVASKRRTP